MSNSHAFSPQSRVCRFNPHSRYLNFAGPFFPLDSWAVNPDLTLRSTVSVRPPRWMLGCYSLFLFGFFPHPLQVRPAFSFGCLLPPSSLHSFCRGTLFPPHLVFPRFRHRPRCIEFFYTDSFPLFASVAPFFRSPPCHHWSPGQLCSLDLDCFLVLVRSFFVPFLTHAWMCLSFLICPISPSLSCSISVAFV